MTWLLVLHPLCRLLFFLTLQYVCKSVTGDYSGTFKLTPLSRANWVKDANETFGYFLHKLVNKSRAVSAGDFSHGALCKLSSSPIWSAAAFSAFNLAEFSRCLVTLSVTC